MTDDPWVSDDSPVDAAVSFEAVKIATTQNKDGFVLKLVIHPNDVPDNIMRDWVGTRYTVAMVKMDDEGQPVMPNEKKALDKAIAIAGELCRDEMFWKYMADVTGLDTQSEDQAAEHLRQYLRIGSRAEIGKNVQVKNVFMGLVGDFEQWMKTSKANTRGHA